jgi:hypothetical protein
MVMKITSDLNVFFVGWGVMPSAHGIIPVRMILVRWGVGV